MAMVASPRHAGSIGHLGFASSQRRSAPRDIETFQTDLNRIGNMDSESRYDYDGKMAGAAKHLSMGDSSDDDEMPAPMKFSALTSALLNENIDGATAASPVRLERKPADASARSNSRAREREEGEEASPKLFPHGSRQRSFPSRTVRLNEESGKPLSQHRASNSPSGRSSAQHESPRPGHVMFDVNTPTPRGYYDTDERQRSWRRDTASAKSHISASAIGLSEERNDHMPATNASGGHGGMALSSIRHAATSIGRPKSTEEGGHGSFRNKRLVNISGTLLRGPARRGKRRQSEEEQSPVDDAAQSRQHEIEEFQRPSSQENKKDESIPSEAQGDLELGDSRPSSPAPIDPRHSRREHEDKVREEGKEVSQKPDSKIHVDRLPSSQHEEGPELGGSPIFKIPSLRRLPPPSQDQENEPPPTFKRGNIARNSMLDEGKALEKKGILRVSPLAKHGERKALAPVNNNTPRRPAPPPPKMSVLETATKTAGASTTSHQRKKRVYMSLNGKLFTRLDCIGRGGSSRVYRVMAENSKIFALKKVDLEDLDELTLRGYKGEINLLEKLRNVHRIINLLDWELNEEKKTLSMLMDIGDIDMNKICDLRLKGDDAKFDSCFVRHHWKEMLECVQGAHQYDIVHSDLKPANFVLVQGTMKLIDFGIADAIQDDTVNVHREQQVGTPNFMSPEAIVDFNSRSGLPANGGRMMKIGKPSDVWSLGCILYQMIYGAPPFAHLKSQYERIMAIPDPRHQINFPAFGLGGVPVPRSAIKVLKRCLDRDIPSRPTVEELLDEGNTFLYPDAGKEASVDVNQEALKAIINRVVSHCKHKGFPSESERADWPVAFFDKLKQGTLN